MLTSEFKYTLIKAGQTLLIVAVAGILLIWLNQSALERFWQQQYHQDSPWAKMAGNPIWDYGIALHDGFQAAGNSFIHHVSRQKVQEHKAATELSLANQCDKLAAPNNYLAGFNFINSYIYPIESLFYTNENLSLTSSKLLKWPQARNQSKVMNSGGFTVEPNHSVIPKDIANIKKGEQVLFVGDSMMQGIAPHIKNMLLKKYNIDSINLSKQSTGLAYLHFFNWPQTIAKTLNDNPNIKILVIFLGPNDPWDMPSPITHKYLKFGSNDWEAVYRERINDILIIARQNNVDVIWIGPPNMRKKKLSDGMKFLRKLYQSEVKNKGEIYFSTNDVFKYKDDDYSDYIGDESSSIKLRSGDGTHFSVRGQKLIAEKVFSLIHFATEKEDTHEIEQVESN